MCGGGVSLGAVVGWGRGCCVVVLWGGVHFLVRCCVGAVFLPWRSPVLGAWASAGVGAGGPVVVGLWWWAVFHPSSLKNGARLKKTGRVGIVAVLFFGITPPYVCISCRGWRGWAVGWAGVGCVNVVDLTKRNPTSHDAG